MPSCAPRAGQTGASAATTHTLDGDETEVAIRVGRGAAAVAKAAASPTAACVQPQMTGTKRKAWTRDSIFMQYPGPMLKLGTKKAPFWATGSRQHRPTRCAAHVIRLTIGEQHPGALRSTNSSSSLVVLASLDLVLLSAAGMVRQREERGGCEGRTRPVRIASNRSLGAERLPTIPEPHAATVRLRQWTSCGRLHLLLCCFGAIGFADTANQGDCGFRQR